MPSRLDRIRRVARERLGIEDLRPGQGEAATAAIERTRVETTTSTDLRSGTMTLSVQPTA